MQPEIKITAQPLTEDRCKFIVDRPVFADGAVYFPSREKAKGSHLAERLFEIENVTAVMVSANEVTVTKSGYDDWVPIGRKIGAAIREQLQSGVPAVSDRALDGRPSETEIREKVQQLLDTEINPAVGMHGGYVSLIDVRGNTVYIQMGGGCQGCGMADVTLKHGIETMIRQTIPEVGEILDATDHASGRNPYYAPTK
jgi:Fe-S cluster biogenesis protein NfuA